MRRRAWLQAGLAAAAAAAAAAAVAAALPPAATLEEHGALDAYAGQGVALAWGVLRGKDEASTTVLVRIEADPARWRALDIVGLDPFTGQRAPLAARVALGATAVTVRIARARFAELPQTQWRFLADPAAAADAAGLVVFYRGVPDTTPEFDDAARLDASLAERLERARRAAPK